MFTSALPLVIAACPNCQLETFEGSSEMAPMEHRFVGNRYVPPVTLRPFAMSGQLCAAHFMMLYAMASSLATSQPSPKRPE